VQAENTPSITELRGKQADLDMKLQSAKLAQADAQKKLDNATKEVDEVRIERQKIDQQITDAINAPLGLITDQATNQ
jgi:septal ring factor EnvC (AmiA/AmiB activator)